MIKIDKASKSFGKRTIFQDISFEVTKGMIFGVIGDNGSGKTILLKCMLGILRLDKGLVTYNGKRLGQDFEFPSQTGILIDNPNFIPELSGEKNLELLASIQSKIGKQEIRKALELVGLDPENKQKVHEYSLGMKQRLGIAQAIMEEPDYIFLDEPLNSIDQTGVMQIRDLLKNLAQQGKAIILTSHIQGDIQTLCDEVYSLNKMVYTY